MTQAAETGARAGTSGTAPDRNLALELVRVTESAATWAGAFTNTIFGFMQAYILLAVYRHRTNVGGYDAHDTLTYVWLVQALLMTVYAFGWPSAVRRVPSSGSTATSTSGPSPSPTVSPL